MNKLLRKIKQVVFNESGYRTQNWGECHDSRIIKNMLDLLHKETGVKVNFTYVPGNAWVPDSGMQFSMEGYTSAQAKKAYQFIDDYWFDWETKEANKIVAKLLFNTIKRDWEYVKKLRRQKAGKINWNLVSPEGLQKERLGKKPNDGTIKWANQDNVAVCKAYGVESIEELVAKAKEVLG